MFSRRHSHRGRPPRPTTPGPSDAAGSGADATDAPPVSAYVAALGMLSRRELSETQVRQRLARKGYTDDAIDEAVARLTSERALDDGRVARAIARSQVSIRRRGRLRVKREMAQAGITGETARDALEAVFEDVDQDALLESALRKRLPDGRSIADPREFQRLYRYLVTQGFESDKALRVLRARRGPAGRDDGDGAPDEGD